MKRNIFAKGLLVFFVTFVTVHADTLTPNEAEYNQKMADIMKNFTAKTKDIYASRDSNAKDAIAKYKSLTEVANLTPELKQLWTKLQEEDDVAKAAFNAVNVEVVASYQNEDEFFTESDLEVAITNLSPLLSQGNRPLFATILRQNFASTKQRLQAYKELVIATNKAGVDAQVSVATNEALSKTLDLEKFYHLEPCESISWSNSVNRRNTLEGYKAEEKAAALSALNASRLQKTRMIFKYPKEYGQYNKSKVLTKAGTGMLYVAPEAEKNKLPPDLLSALNKFDSSFAAYQDLFSGNDPVIAKLGKQEAAFINNAASCGVRNKTILKGGSSSVVSSPVVTSLELNTNVTANQGSVLGGECVASLTGFKGLAVGSKGQDVLKVQNQLKKLRYLSATPNGYYGQATKKAVMAFQRAHGVTPVGSVGKKTLQALNSTCK